MSPFDAIDRLHTLPYWIIDILPKQVPADGEGQYFKIEQYFLSEPQHGIIDRRFANVLLKLNCYKDLTVCLAATDKHLDNPTPQELEEMVMSRQPLSILLDGSQSLIDITGDNHYMTLYGRNEETLNLINSIATAEGLHLWKP